jgi:SRSO17 transposase
VGVQRQYSGTLGKIGNCQVAASLTIATRTERVPVDFALYLPESWTDNPARRAEAHIPKGVTFKTKPELGLEMIERAVADGLPTGLVLADSAYGGKHRVSLARALRRSGLQWACTVPPRRGAWTRSVGAPAAPP